MILDRLHATSEDEDFAANITLDALVRRLALSRGESVALIDPSDRPVFTDGVPRRLTWAALDREIDRIAAGLRSIGLPRDSVVALQMPNTVESVISLLAVIRAGLIAAPMPLAWRRREIATALAQTGAKAAIGVSRTGPLNVADDLCEAASEVFAVRFILAFGRAVPDGVIPIDEDFGTDPDDGTAAPASQAGRAADHVALITFDASADGIIPTPRSHRQVVAAGLAHILEAEIGAADIIATSLLGAGIAALATGVVSSLLAGVPLVLHQPFSSRVFAGSIVTEGVTHAVLPGKAVASLMQAGRLPSGTLRGVSAIWRTGEEPAGVFDLGADRPVTDVTAYGELGIFCARRRPGEEPLLLPLGRAAPLGARKMTASTLLATRIGPEGRLDLGGVMVPGCSFPGPGAIRIEADIDGWMPTGIGCTEIGREALGTASFREGVVQIGGLALPRSDSVALAEDLAGNEASAELAADPLFGTRMVCTRPEALRDAMATSGVTPALMPARRNRTSHADAA